MVSEFWHDARHAMGLLLRAPAFTIVVLVTLGLGIGANTALFSVVKAVLLAPRRGRARPGVHRG